MKCRCGIKFLAQGTQEIFQEKDGQEFDKSVVKKDQVLIHIWAISARVQKCQKKIFLQKPYFWTLNLGVQAMKNHKSRGTP